MPAGLDVRGGGPASRESELLDPLAAASSIHAIVLSGGIAYGLGAADGDSIYAVSVGNVEADQDLVGSLSAVVMSEAIKRAVYSADSAYGFKSAKDIKN